MRFLIFIFLLLFGACSSPATKKLDDDILVGGIETDKKYKGLLWYNVAFDTEMRVGVRLLHPPPQTRLFLPMRWGGRSDLAERIHIHSAEGPKGPLAFTIDRTEGVVEIDARNAEWVQLQYTVDLDGTDRVHPQMERGNVFAFVPSFLVRPSSSILSKLIDIPVEIRTPENWLVASTWPLVDKKKSSINPEQNVWSYLVADPSQLVDAFINAGPKLKTRTIGNVSLVINTNQFDESEQLAQFVFEIVNSFSKRYGDAGETKVVVRPRRRKREGYFGMGRRGGFVLELDKLTNLEKEAKILIAHEAFHLWNGHSLVSHVDSVAQTRWFKEGLTEYIAIKKLYQLGHLTRMDFLDELASGASTYWSNPARSKEALTGEDAEALSYDRGMLLAFAIDTMFFKISDSASIEDWLVSLTQTKEAKAPGYTAKLLRRSLFEHIPFNNYTQSFWRRFVAGKETLDLRDIFVQADLHYLPRRFNRAAKLIELEKKDPLYDRLFALP